MKDLVSTLATVKAANIPHVNHEGATSFRRSLREQVLQVLSTNTLSDTFYVGKEQLALETVEVLLEAREKDHRFLARAIVWARQEGLMKLVPTLALAILSGKKGIDESLFRNTFMKTILTPDDLRTYVMLIKGGVTPGRSSIGGKVRDVVREWIGGISEYHAIKYGSARSEGFTLRDIIRLTHPKPASDEYRERFGWLVQGSVGSDSALNPKIAAFEKLKRAKTDEEIVSLIEQGRLPYEVVVPSVSKMTPAIWTALLYQAPYMNLLRNLNSFREHNVFESEKNVEFAVEKLTNRSAVESSRVLPFRFIEALKAFSFTGPQDMRIIDALRQGLELSFVNLPDFGLEKHVTIGTDVSGSMSDVSISEKSSTKCIDIAGIFTGALLKRTNKSLALPFEGRVVNIALSKHDSIAETARKIAKVGGGSTAVGAPIEYLLSRKIKTDVFIGITDNVDWSHGQDYETSDAFLPLWRRYKREVNPDAEAFLVTIAPYRDAVAPQSEKGVHYIYGWSEKVLNYIGLKLSTGVSQVDKIMKIEL
jgi:60 kDa SS-A/Ro ribonucleoprotein